jgi:hypothetical protein
MLLTTFYQGNASCREKITDEAVSALKSRLVKDMSRVTISFTIRTPRGRWEYTRELPRWKYTKLPSGA